MKMDKAKKVSKETHIYLCSFTSTINRILPIVGCYMTNPSIERRIYPEVSYVFVSTVVEGLMGIEMDVPENTVQTTPKLPKGLEWVELKNIPWKEGIITIRHDGVESTSITNNSKAPGGNPGRTS